MEAYFNVLVELELIEYIPIVASAGINKLIQYFCGKELKKNEGRKCNTSSLVRKITQFSDKLAGWLFSKGSHKRRFLRPGH